ncbi:MAG: uracil-DNA glycosylase family protein, partial [Betaproteobacteria bacterium]
MNRRAWVLKKLGLSPLWVRRGSAGRGDPVAGAALTHDEQRGDADGYAPAARAGTGRAEQINTLDWLQLKSSASACTACVLHKTRKQAVLGVGDEKAEWLFVGEGPGAEEDERGEPFVGQAG